MSQIAVYVSGVITLFIGLYHVKLYEIRNLNEKLKDLDLFTQRILYTINLALTLLFIIISIISFIYATELSEGTGLAFGFNIFLLCFWTWRVIWGLTYLKEVSNNKITIFDIVKKSVGPILIISYLIPIINVISQSK